MVIPPPPDDFGGVGFEGGVERDEDRAVFSFGDVLEVVHPIYKKWK